MHLAHMQHDKTLLITLSQVGLREDACVALSGPLCTDPCNALMLGTAALEGVIGCLFTSINQLAYLYAYEVAVHLSCCALAAWRPAALCV